ncbi:MAG: OmpA family protein [Burkholderiales bacterium]|nr:OmpA family protein [Burkholderiales bacterium]
MRPSLLLNLSLVPLSLLAACDAPPKASVVDESTRRPANSSAAVELQVCKGDLQHARLLASEAGQLTRSTAATLASIATSQQALTSMPSSGPTPTCGNRIYTVHFDFGSSHMTLSAEAAKVLIDEAKAAPLVLLRGRTDGISDAIAESRMARDRAIAMRDYLVAAGIEPSRIRATYQPAGDHVADNSSPSGRALNRRVEIEIYRVAPVAIAAKAPGD